jgi:hypothetical protein
MRYHHGPRHGQAVPERIHGLRGDTLILHGVRYDYQTNGVDLWELVSVKLAVPAEPSRRAFYDKREEGLKG